MLDEELVNTLRLTIHEEADASEQRLSKHLAMMGEIQQQACYEIEAVKDRFSLLSNDITFMHNELGLLRADMAGVKSELEQIVSTLNKAKTEIKILQISQQSIETKVETNLGLMKQEVERFSDYVQRTGNRFLCMLETLSSHLTLHKNLPVERAHPNAAH